MSTYRPHIFKTFEVSTIQIGGLEPELQILKVSTKKFDAVSSFVYLFIIIIIYLLNALSHPYLR